MVTALGVVTLFMANAFAQHNEGQAMSGKTREVRKKVPSIIDLKYKKVATQKLIGVLSERLEVTKDKAAYLLEAITLAEKMVQGEISYLAKHTYNYKTKQRIDGLCRDYFTPNCRVEVSVLGRGVVGSYSIKRYLTVLAFDKVSLIYTNPNQVNVDRKSIVKTGNHQGKVSTLVDQLYVKHYASGYTYSDKTTKAFDFYCHEENGEWKVIITAIRVLATMPLEKP